VNQYEVHAQRGEKIQVMSQVEEAAVRNEVTAEGDDENLAAKRVDVGSDGLEPVDEPVLAGETLAPRRLGAFRYAVFDRIFFSSIRNWAPPAPAPPIRRTRPAAREVLRRLDANVMRDST
jgi:hypothetical protein